MKGGSKDLLLLLLYLVLVGCGRMGYRSANACSVVVRKKVLFLEAKRGGGGGR